MIIKRLKNEIMPGTVIPKPEAKADHKVKGWGIRRGEEALIYLIPNHNDSRRPYPKGVNISEWRKAYQHIISRGDFSKAWFKENLSDCAMEGDCNFTTIGGIFKLLQLAYYDQRGVYKKLDK